MSVRGFDLDVLVANDVGDFCLQTVQSHAAHDRDHDQQQQHDGKADAKPDADFQVLHDELQGNTRQGVRGSVARGGGHGARR
jgi:hypothetical protein